MHKERLDLNDSIIDMITKLSEGNPGAVGALCALVKDAPGIDPDSAFGPYTALISFDTFGIYGTGIYVLWNDVCSRDTRLVLSLLRSVQLGFVPVEDLRTAANDQRRGNHFPADRIDAIDRMVCERLPAFKRAA